MSLTVRYLDVPQGAQQAMMVAGEGQPFSDPAEVSAGVADASYATLELGQWPLDGSRCLLPDEPAQVGWWSEALSDEQGNFTEPPTLTVSFPEPFTATGLTFTFSPSTSQWCSAVRVTWLNGQTQLAQTIAYPDSPRWVLEQKVESFDTIRIELLATNQPQNFAKLQQLTVGQTILFDKEELIAVRQVNEADPMLCVLTVDTMTVEIRDRAGRSLAPQENQRMELYRDDALLAVQYISKSGREAQQYYSFSCQSAIGLLGDEFLGGLFVDMPVEELLAEILDGATYELDASFAGLTVTGYLPVCTRREALQQLAFAIGALVTTYASHAICLRPIPEAIAHTFAPGEIFTGAKVETAPQKARIEVTAHGYTPSTEAEMLLDEESISGEDLLLTFDAPHYDYTIVGGTITASGANWVRVTANGTVTLTGKPYIHSTMLHTKRDPQATAAERNNVLTVDSATLVNSGNVSQVLERLYAAAQLRQTLTQDAVIKAHRAGQRVSSVNPWGTLTRGFITAMDSTLTQNGHTASITISGVEVEAEGVYIYAGELYAGGKEVLY